MPTELSILDPHVHLWHPRDTPRQVTPLVKALGWSPRLTDWVARRVFPRAASDFFATPEHVTRPYLIEDFDADRAHHPVTGIVHIEAGWQGKGPLGPVGETRWLETLSATGAGRIEAIVAHADLGLGKAVADVLRAHLEASARVRGVRDTLSWHPNKRVLNGATGPERSRDPSWREGFEQLAEFGLSFEATVYHNQLEELAELAAAYPEQPIMLCHTGTPVAVGGPFATLGATESERDATLGAWKAGMARLAQSPNVSVKLSGLGMPVCGFGWERRETEPSVEEVTEAFAPIVNFAIDTFGADRCSFASNFPVDKVSMSYEVLFDAFQSIAGDHPPLEQQQLLCDNAKRFYRLTSSGGE